MKITSITKQVAAIPRQSLASAVADKIREKILRGELKEGDQLRQEVLAAEFQVSKVPVREAFSYLAAKGLVRIVTNHGAIVSALSPDEIELQSEDPGPTNIPIPNTVAAIPRRSLAFAVADKLREKIIRGELKEGEQLRQDVLAAEFQVSKIPVREAFSYLAAEGLVKIVTNRGAIVSALSPVEIEQMFEIRAVLECFILRRAIVNFTEDDFLQAERKLDEYEHLVKAETDVTRWSEWNWEFHSVFYSRANLPVAMSMLKTLNTNCDRYTQMVLLFSGNINYTAGTHRTLLDAFRTRDADLACHVLWQHLMDASRLLTEFINNRPE